MIPSMTRGLAIACSALILAGCGSPAQPTISPATTAATAGSAQVTLHIKDMTRRLKLV